MAKAARWSAGPIAAVVLVFGLVASEAVAGEAAQKKAATPASPPAITSDKLSKALAEFNRGAALLEQYRFEDAGTPFEDVLKVFPNWTAARFNLGIAYMQRGDSREKMELAPKEFAKVLAADPKNLHARFCLGLYYQRAEQKEEALACFEKVYQADSNDPYVAYKYAEALLGLGRKDEAVRPLEKAIALDPGFISAIYRLASFYQSEGKQKEAFSLFRRFRELYSRGPAGASDAFPDAYGKAGKYSMALDAAGLPISPRVGNESPRIIFSPEIKRLDVCLKPWKWAGGAIKLPGIAVGDLNGDGHLDLVLTAAGEDGATSAWFNDGKGRFSPGPRIADKGVSPCLGDVNNDGHLDLWLGRAGWNLLFHNDGKGHFTRVPSLPKTDDGRLTACARLLDIDSDGNLDLLAFRWASGSIPAGGNALGTASSLQSTIRTTPNFLWSFFGRQKKTIVDLAPALGLTLAHTPVSAMVYDDFDNDRDLDLILFPPKGKPIAWVNDRAGKYHILDAAATGLDVEGVVGATSGDPFKTGNRDLLVFTAKEVRLYRNRGGFKFELDRDFANRCGRLGGTGGQFADMDNDGDLDIVIADAHRRDGTRGPALLVNDWPNRRYVDAADLDPGNLLSAIHTKGAAACVVADFNGDGKLDILLAEMNQPPMLIENATNGGHYIAIDLVGKRPKTRMCQSDASAIGARVEFRSGTVSQQYVVGLPSGPTAMPPLRIHAGLGNNTQVQWLRIIWPDCIMQAELELAADRTLKIEEVQRLVDSCPHLYAWDGSRFELVSDFAGVGGLGYWVAPGTYAIPRPTEYVPIRRLETQNGQYVLQILVSLEDLVYVDEAKLIAVDHPVGTEVYPNEMMAIGVPQPPFEVFCFREPIEPVKAVDHRGIDVTRELRRIDRSYAGATDLDQRLYGYAKDHWVELDFGDRLRGLPANSRLILVCYGSTEYPYSSTNYAASRVGLRMKAPSLHVWRNGRWVEVLHEVGCPAGMQHVMTVDLTGKVLPTDRKIRISTNMEIYWDRMFLAVPLAKAPVRLKEIPVASADLHFLGYARAYSPDGRRPELYDYARVERTIPWKLMKGQYTRYGEVAELLRETDDCYAIMGRGDELTLRFPADAFGPVPPGCRRSFLVKIDSYTKDMDLYTPYGETVQPLPFHAMRSYPYGRDQHYPDNEKTKDYRRRFNTRRVE